MAVEKVVVALSGGVDSSVAAALARQTGREVVGVTLRLKHPDPAFSAAQLCASKSDEEAVLQVCETLRIEHHFLELFPEFERRVLLPAAREYGCGRTPNPCCECNPAIKFGALTRFARSIGATKVLTGHYAKLSGSGGIVELRRGDDLRKDQSYFLYRLDQEILAMTEFPVGGMEKSRVREIAAEHGFVTSAKPDSQDACFQVPGECFGETLRRLFDLPNRSGAFLWKGRVVGRHSGIHRYTIGQRKGLNVALGVPAYIVAIDPESGNIELATDPAELECRSFTVDRLVWQSGREPIRREMQVQIRYRSGAVPCRIEPAASGARVFLSEAVRAVTPGQAAVFYDGALLLGGGVILSGAETICC